MTTPPRSQSRAKNSLKDVKSTEFLVSSAMPRIIVEEDVEALAIGGTILGGGGGGWPEMGRSDGLLARAQKFNIPVTVNA